MQQMAGMVDRSRTVNGVPTSLLDLGYSDVGLDDNWQACGKYGPNGYTFHDANGRPVVNEARFPDFKAMTSYAHSLGLTSGWYGNNCICSDHCDTLDCYQGDVDAVMDYGFDSIKLDGCGRELDLTLYAALFNATGKSILMENCHWGGTVPNATWCPWNYFRSSGDIRASYDAVVGNLQSTIQWAKAGLSKPGCFAYPDMLEVGCAHGPGGPSDPGLSFIEARSHFAAWCIVSSPLILSHDLTNATIGDAVWPIISNTELLAVSKAWAGFSGSVYKAASAVVPVSAETAKANAGLRAVPAWQFWYKPVDAATTAVMLMNHAATTAAFTVAFADVPGLSATTAYKLRDAYAHADLGTFTGTYTPPPTASHDSVFLIITPA